MPADNYDQATFFPGTRKGNDMVRMRAGRFQRFVGSSTEKVAPTVTKAQQVTDQDEFDERRYANLRRADQDGRSDQSRCRARRVVDLAPVVGIDQGQVPKLCSLVKVGHARQRHLECELRQRV